MSKIVKFDSLLRIELLDGNGRRFRIENIRRRQQQIFLRLREIETHADFGVARELALDKASTRFSLNGKPLREYLTREVDGAMRLIQEAAAERSKDDGFGWRKLSTSQSEKLLKASRWIDIKQFLGPDGLPRESELDQLQTQLEEGARLWNSRSESSGASADGWTAPEVTEFSLVNPIFAELCRAWAEAISQSSNSSLDFRPFIAKSIERSWHVILMKRVLGRQSISNAGVQVGIREIEKPVKSEKRNKPIYYPESNVVGLDVTFVAGEYPGHDCKLLEAHIEIRLGSKAPGTSATKALLSLMDKTGMQTGTALQEFFGSNGERMFLHVVPGASSLCFDSHARFSQWLPQAPINAEAATKLRRLAAARCQNGLIVSGTALAVIDSEVKRMLIDMMRSVPLPKMAVNPQGRPSDASSPKSTPAARKSWLFWLWRRNKVGR